MSVLASRLAAFVLVSVLGAAPALLAFAAPASASSGTGWMQDAPAQLVGTWVRERNDGNTSQKITLVLRGDGTYTKTLEARVNGTPYGGTHDGTWTAKDTTVTLSGDGNWPRISHDLSEFRKVE